MTKCETNNTNKQKGLICDKSIYKTQIKHAAANSQLQAPGMKYAHIEMMQFKHVYEHSTLRINLNNSFTAQYMKQTVKTK